MGGQKVTSPSFSNISNPLKRRMEDKAANTEAKQLRQMVKGEI